MAKWVRVTRTVRVGGTLYTPGANGNPGPPVSLPDADADWLVARKRAVAVSSTVDPGLTLDEPVGAVVFVAGASAPPGYLPCNGAAVSRTVYAALFNELVLRPAFPVLSFTVSIATPAVFTSNGHGFTGGERIRLDSSGTLPTGLTKGNEYFVSAIDANTFNVYSTLSGGLVNTSGSAGSGHTFQRSLWGLGNGSTTFNIPDLRGLFLRALDSGKGIDGSRTPASIQPGSILLNTQTSNLMTPVIASAAARIQFGFDAVNATDYPLAGMILQLIAGTSTSAANTSVTGMSRPINAALLACIKY